MKTALQLLTVPKESKEFFDDLLLGKIEEIKNIQKIYLKVGCFDANKIIALDGKSPNLLQRSAIGLAMKKAVSLIHGPPGTGKTEVALMIISNLLIQLKTLKILVCAPSNVATDLLALKLDQSGIKPIRLFSHRYDPIDPSLKKLDLLEHIFHRNENLRQNYEKYIAMEMTMADHNKYKDEFSKAEEEVWESVQVTCTTCITSGREDFKDRHYDVVLIDEATKATEPEILVPIMHHGATKVILIGDHKQLGPVVMSDKALKAGYGISLFERLIKQDPTILPSVMLREQYRMCKEIAEFPSKYFYEKYLQTLAKDSSIQFDFLGNNDKPIIFFNVVGVPPTIGFSLFNQVEATFIKDLVKQIRDCGTVSSKNVTIITFYEAQRLILNQLLKSEINMQYKAFLEEIEIVKVDAFQGRENEVIIISFVRTACYEEKHKLGFLDDPGRANVALTRAKQKLLIIGDKTLLAQHKLYKSLIETINKVGSVIDV